MMPWYLRIVEGFRVRLSAEYQASRSLALSLSTGTVPKRGTITRSMALRVLRRLEGDQSGDLCPYQVSRSSATVMECAAPSPMPYLAAVLTAHCSAAALVAWVELSWRRAPVAESWTLTSACQDAPRLRTVPCMWAPSMDPSPLGEAGDDI